MGSNAMKCHAFAVFTAIAMTPLLLNGTAVAQSRPSIQLTPAQTQQLSRDLVRSSSQDFFEQGQAHLEKEIGILTQRRLFLQEGVLKISQDLQIQPDFSKFERPNNLPLAR